MSGKMVDKSDLKQEMVDKWSIKPSLAEKLVDILGFVAGKDETTTESIVSGKSTSYQMSSASAVNATMPIMKVVSASPAIRKRTRMKPFKRVAAPKLRMVVAVVRYTNADNNGNRAPM